MHKGSPHLSIVETETLKGLGILLIVLHNFFHVLPPKIGENEFFFSTATYSAFQKSLGDDPTNIARLVFSYFGHFGVHIFVFLSAYGLARKYIELQPDFKTFLFDRFLKIYPTFIFCVGFFIFIKFTKAIISGNQLDFTWENVFWKLTILSNLIPNEAMTLSGPWWFIPFILQFYIFFPVLLKAFRLYGNLFLLSIAILSISCELIFNEFLMGIGLNINYTFIGHLPVICLGIFLANQESMRIKLPYTFLAILTFIASNFYNSAWIISDVAFMLITLVISGYFMRYGQNVFRTSQMFYFYGVISFHLFLLNGFLRPPFTRFAEANNLSWIDNLSALSALAFSTICAYYFQSADKYIRRSLSK